MLKLFLEDPSNLTVTQVAPEIEGYYRPLFFVFEGLTLLSGLLHQVHALYGLFTGKVCITDLIYCYSHKPFGILRDARPWQCNTQMGFSAFDRGVCTTSA